MAFTERYVTSGAGGGGDGSSGSPWTLAEALNQAVAGDRVNIQSDAGYSLGADTVDNNGNIADAIVFRGYNSTIGDLEASGRNTDGSLNTTNYPVITLTGTLDISANYIIYQNLVFTGSINGDLLNSATATSVTFIECTFTNTNAGGSAGCMRSDNYLKLLSCDLECTAGTHTRLVDADLYPTAINCRFKMAANTYCITGLGLIAINSCFIGNGTGIGVYFQNSSPNVVVGCTFYDLGTAVAANAVLTVPVPLVAVNHATDNNKWLSWNTSDHYTIEYYNRTRDNVTPRENVGDGANVGEVTTDTGGAATDYVDAGNDDFHLINGAAGVEAGPDGAQEIGAYQRPSSGGGTSVIK